MTALSWTDSIEPTALHSLHTSAGDLVALSHGAQAISWVVDGRERLYISPNAGFGENQAIRGGVPVIFPQFGSFGPGLRHGFARLLRWQPEPLESPGKLTFSLEDDARTRALWPHAFHARLCISTQDHQLALELVVGNRGGQAFSFTSALHTYLSVCELATAHLQGLQGCDYLDATLPDRPIVRGTSQNLHFEGELDRIYFGTGDRRLALSDDLGKIELSQFGFNDTVVWNPGQTLGDTMADLGIGEYRRFVCIEAACIATPVHLEPGEQWSGRQTLRVLRT